jgi:hypothetical protein
MIDMGRSDLRLLLLLGAPRSGTSWSAKVFDSHPRVLYRHEPDISLRAEDIPNVPAREDIPRYIPAARTYLAKLLQVRSIKAVGSRPSFPKEYDKPFMRPLRESMITAFRVLELAGPLRPLVGRIAIPDLVDEDRLGDVHLVIKSVSSGARARLFADALPEGRLIFLLRHPGGQVASMLRGIRLGKFPADGIQADLIETKIGRRYGLSVDRLAGLPLLDQLVWNWVLFNEKVMDDLADAPNARIARHNDLVADPIGQFSELFAFAGLSWTPQTEAFIRKSTSAPTGAGYYSVRRNAADTLDAWRSEVTPEERARISDIMRQTAIAARWPDLAE